MQIRGNPDAFFLLQFKHHLAEPLELHRRRVIVKSGGQILQLGSQGPDQMDILQADLQIGGDEAKPLLLLPA
ncbi:hypothetical protein D3C75_973480 [compost metagenome]